jgi:hypothetical protein
LTTSLFFTLLFTPLFTLYNMMTKREFPYNVEPIPKVTLNVCHLFFILLFTLLFTPQFTLYDMMTKREFPYNVEPILLGRELRLQKDKRRRLVTLKLVLQQLLEALDTAHATGIGELFSGVFGCCFWRRVGFPMCGRQDCCVLCLWSCYACQWLCTGSGLVTLKLLGRELRLQKDKRRRLVRAVAS